MEPRGDCIEKTGPDDRPLAIDTPESFGLTRSAILISRAPIARKGETSGTSQLITEASGHKGAG
jgi:hypothetical protein